VITRPVEAGRQGGDRPPRLEAKNRSTAISSSPRKASSASSAAHHRHSIALAPVIDRTGVPAVTWTGTDRYHGQYCFTSGTAGLAEEAAMRRAWIRRRTPHRTR